MTVKLLNTNFLKWIEQQQKNAIHPTPGTQYLDNNQQC